MGEYLTCLFSGIQRSAVSYDSLLSCHLENIQRSVDAISPSMPSTDLMGTQDRQPNREINSLSVSDWGQQPPPLLSGCHRWRAPCLKCIRFICYGASRKQRSSVALSHCSPWGLHSKSWQRAERGVKQNYGNNTNGKKLWKQPINTRQSLNWTYSKGKKHDG